MSSLDEALQSLEMDLTGSRASIAAQSGIPFAILRYSPSEEFLFRRKIRLFANSLEQRNHLRVKFISISRLVWQCIVAIDGAEYLYKTESQYGSDFAENDIKRRLLPKKNGGLAGRITAILDADETKYDLVILVRVGGLAPRIYPCSALLNDLQMAGHCIPTILCYPGSSVVGTDLRFYDLPTEEGLGTYNYRVKIYGTH
jgi:hypothetical protein